MQDWREKTGAVRATIEELRSCFQNMIRLAESLDVKMVEDHENLPKYGMQEIISVARRTSEKLSYFSQACGLLAEASLLETREKPAMVAFPMTNGETLPVFPEYVRRKYGVELDEDLVTMIEDLIERQRKTAKTRG